LPATITFDRALTLPGPRGTVDLSMAPGIQDLLCRSALCICLIGCAAAPPAPAGVTPSPAGAGAIPTAALAEAAPPPPREDGRLPPEARPRHYALDLHIDPTQPTFSGRAWIGVTLDRATSTVVLHGRGLTVRDAAFVRAGRRVALRAATRASAGSGQDAEELMLTAREPLPPGEGELDIAYEAPFSPGLKGLYRVQQRGDSYAYTQFEPNDARRAFPCFDEPGYKTPFDLALTVPRGSIAVANSPEATRRDSDDGKSVRFEFRRSEPLPTYLVALAVGPFDILDGPQRPVPIRMIATRGQTALGAGALQVAAAHLELLGRYFDRPYPYAKLDLVAVPNFGSGAMENAGLVTFREELVLLDPAAASTAARRASASVIAHELAHQWFGDLVTMKWWDDLWLNEAFASWMSDKLVDEWRPETRARLANLTGKWHVMAEDALSTARKIRNPVRNTSQAREAFDAITYGKGRSVLAMAEAWLGEDVFRDGLRRYIKKHEWGNATAADLYAALAEASGGRPVAAVMNSFTDQTGVPLVGATVDCPSSSVRLVQHKYRTLDQLEVGRAAGAEPPPDPLWFIPACTTARGGQKPFTCTVLDRREGRLNIASASATGTCPAFVYPNAGEGGYFRVALTAADLGRLDEAALLALPESERAGIVNNAWAAVWSGGLRAADLLSFLRHFRTETSRLVWVQIIDSLNGIDRGLVSEAARPSLSRLARTLLTPLTERLRWMAPARRVPPETDDDKLLRELALLALGGLGDDPRVLGEARKRANAWLDRADTVPADVARVALPLAARKGDSRLFERLLAVLRNPATPEIRLLALSGLSGFEDPILVRRTLDLTLDGTIRAQDLRYVFPPLAQRRATRETTFTWIETHFDELAPRMPSSQLARFIRLGGALCDAERVRSLHAFLQPRAARFEGTAKDVRLAHEEGMRCALLAARERDVTSDWLRRNVAGR
jgi:cytosol alanyl aminopeptidase